MGFASAVGLMVASPSPTWRDTSVWLAILSGFWIIVVAIGSFALGGYLAGRVRSTWKASEDEVEFRDGAHGLLVWAVGVVLGAVLLRDGEQFRGRQCGVAAARYRGRAGLPRLRDSTGCSARSAGSSRSRPRFAPKRRILMKGLGRQELPADDRTHLTRLIAGARAWRSPTRNGG